MTFTGFKKKNPHTFSALAGVHVGPINTFGPIFTWGASALVDVKLALATRES